MESSEQEQRLAAVLVAAGRGARFGGDTPKQFAMLEGRPLYAYAAAELCRSPLVHSLVIVVPEERVERVRAEIGSLGLASTPVRVVAGGASRRESVACGLEAAADATHVLVHDAVRPFLTQRLIRDAVAAVHRHGAATVALPVSDTLMRGEAATEHAATTLDRDGVWAVQTPQVFERTLLLEAHAHAHRQALEATDDGSLVLALGRRLDLVRGNWWNLKVTHADDLRRAACILKMRSLLDEDGGPCSE